MAIGLTGQNLSANTLDPGALARLRMDAATSQQMRVFHMVKSSCLIMVDAAPDFHSQSANDSVQMFDATMHMLAKGDDAVGAAPERRAVLLSDLELAQKTARDVTASVQQIAARDLHSVPVMLLLTRSDPTIEQLNVLIEAYKQDYKASGADADLAETIIYAAQQRTNSQRIMRDFCFLAVDVSVEGMRKSLAETSAAFEIAIDALIDGDATRNIRKAPSIQIKITLKKVRGNWAKLKEMSKRAADTGTMTVEDMQIASVLMDSILKDMNKVMQEYFKL